MIKMELNKLNNIENLPICYSTNSPSESHSAQESFSRLQKRIEQTEKENSMHKHLVLWKCVTIAASIVLLFGLCFFFLSEKELPEMKVFSTVAGQSEQITLPDGSIVWVNADTRIVYPEKFNMKVREVYISGEAFFEVKKNPSCPFIVKTDKLDIKVLGTKFNVKSYPDEFNIETTLVEGSVSIASLGKQTLLRPNQQLVLRKSDGKISLYDNINLKHYVGWTNGHFYFRQATIEDVAKKIERVFDVKIHIESEKLRERRFTGRIDKNESIEEILNAIKITTPYSYSINNNTIILKDK